MERVPLIEALRHRESVLRSFLDPEGRLTVIPVKHVKRLVILDHLAQLFEPGVRYPEVEVNRRLRAVHDDVAALRRYLVEDGFLDRDVEAYWRIGGTVPDDGLDPAPLDPAPSDPAPLDPAPSDAAPLDPAPSDPAPLDPAPSE